LADRGLARRKSKIKGRKWSLAAVVDGQRLGKAEFYNQKQKMELGGSSQRTEQIQGLVSKW